jgi:uncharacterized protein (TIGR02217 family)
VDLFPTLAGLAWDIGKIPAFNTEVEDSVSGRENRISMMVYPKWTFTLKYNFLRDSPNVASPTAPLDELKKLVGFFLNQRGRKSAFLYDDLTDDAVTDMQFGTGDGTTVAFQLVRSYGAGGFGFAEPVQNLNGAVTNIKDNGGVVGGGDYSVSSTGLVTFNTAPLAGHTLTWTGAYYWRVRFTRDTNELNQFLKDLWEAKKVEFTGALGNRV